MGKSINPLHFYNAVNSGPSLILSGAWIPGAHGLAGGNVFIIKETGEKRYNVTDGATTGEVYLTESADAVEGQGWIQIADSDEFVYKIYDTYFVTNKGNRFTWSIDTSADVTLPSSTFPSQTVTKKATINAAGPDKLVENLDKTISEVNADINEELEGAQHVKGEG